MARRAAKVDANQPEIVAAYRKAGATVHPLHAVGGGCPDLLVGYRGLNYIVEVIGPDKLKRFKKSGGLSEGQVDWHRDWRGAVHVVKNIEEALAVIGLADTLRVVPIIDTIS